MSYLTILCGHHVNYVIYGHNMLKGSHYDIKSRNKPQFCSNPENTENTYKNGRKSPVNALNGKTYWGFDLF